MARSSWRLRLTGRAIVVLALVLGLLTATTVGVAASEPAPDPATAEFEVQFLKTMTDHHTMAVGMAAICVGKAVHDELRDMCHQIIADQSREIVTMESWLIFWYQTFSVPQLTGDMISQMVELATLSSGDFEIAFMQMMSEHHSMAIMEAEACVECAYHDELVNLCESIITTQAAENEQMQAWLCEWYGICEPE